MPAKFVLIPLIVILVVLAVGASVLAFWDIPAPQTRIEKAIPNERLSR